MLRRITIWLLLLTMSLACLTGAYCEAAPQPQQLSRDVLGGYFADALFIGDSITRQLHAYVNKKRQEEGLVFKPTFVTATSYTLYTASRRTVGEKRAELTYRGRTTPMFRIVERMKPGKLFILLGVNDYAGTHIEQSIGYAERIIDLAAEVSPETRVVFISLTPVTQAFCKKKDYRTLWDRYNEALEAMCTRRGVGYLDVATDLKGEDGYLKKGYSSDGQYHLSSRALQVWLDDLLAFAQREYEAGRWSPAQNGGAK